MARADRPFRFGTMSPSHYERGPGFVTASVADRSGNVLGIMYNRHYLDILANRGGAL